MQVAPSISIAVKRSFQTSLRNIWRNKVLSLATIFVIAIILFIFNIILAINFTTQNALNAVSSKVDIIFYVKESATPERIDEIVNFIKDIAGVKNAQYFSKEKAFQELKKLHPDLSLAFEKYKLGNPLPASINISLENPDNYAIITSRMIQSPYANDLTNILDDESGINESAIMASVTQNLLKVSDFANQIIFWLIITFIIGGILIIVNALHITIFSRQKEIGIMKLVGASPWSIKLPFILESIIYGIAAILISSIMMIALLKNMQIKNLTSNIPLEKIASTIFLELALTIVVATLSAYIAVHKYLQKDEKSY